MFNFDEANRKSKEAVDGVMRSYSDLIKGFQAIAAETGDVQKKSLQDMTTYFEQLMATRSIESLYELNANFAKSSYESFLARSMKLSEMYIDVAKGAYKPYEAPVARTTAIVATQAA